MKGEKIDQAFPKKWMPSATTIDYSDYILREPVNFPKEGLENPLKYLLFFHILKLKDDCNYSNRRAVEDSGNFS